MSATAAGRTVLLLVGLALSLGGCQASDLQFHNDHRLHFSSPKARQLVKAPLAAWTMTGFATTGLDGSRDKGSGAFAGFVDRAPMPVGKDLKWLARNDTGCRRDPRCPDAKYLADRGVYVTTTPTVTLDLLPAAPDGVGDEQHFVNVVLVDGTGHRIGESAWYRPFQTKRRSTS